MMDLKINMNFIYIILEIYQFIVVQPMILKIKNFP